MGDQQISQTDQAIDRPEVPPVIPVDQQQTVQTNIRRTILGAGWGTLKVYVKYKAAEAGVLYKEIELEKGNQLCCRCGKQSEQPLELENTEFECHACGSKLQRGLNTAINLIEGTGTRLCCCKCSILSITAAKEYKKR